MSEMETLDHRTRRLGALAEALETQLGDEEEWFYCLVIAQHGQPETVNLITNIPDYQHADQVLEATLEELRRRFKEGLKPTDL